MPPKPPTVKATYELYDGKAILQYMEKGRSHWYEYRGSKLPNVTSVCGSGGSPDPLLYWAVNCMADKLRDTVPVGKALDEIEKEELISESKYAFRTEQKRALDIGGNVHDWVEAHIRLLIEGKPDKRQLPLNEEMRSSVDTFLKFEKDSGIQYISTERKVMSIEYGFAGTLDIQCRFPNGKEGVLDLKTSKAIYETYYMQLAAYKLAVDEEDETDHEENYIVRIPKDGGDVEVKQMTAEIYEQAIQAFLGRLVAYNSLERLKGLI